MRHAFIFLLCMLGCMTTIEHRACGLTDGSTTTTTASTTMVPTTSSSDGGSSGSATIPCEIHDGELELGSRSALVVGADAAAGGPLIVYLHGTYETPEGVLAWDSAAMALADVATTQGGVMLLPRGRLWYGPDAATYPWAAVTDGAAGTAHADDLQLVSDAIGCARSGAAIDDTRIIVAGFSAGGIATSYMLPDLLLEHPIAAIAIWSGGVAPIDRPADLTGLPAAMLLHGGADDFGGYFETAVTALANDAAAADAFVLLCNHEGGHATAMADDAAAFVTAAGVGGHPWAMGWSGWTLEAYCTEVL